MGALACRKGPGLTPRLSHPGPSDRPAARRHQRWGRAEACESTLVGMVRYESAWSPPRVGMSQSEFEPLTPLPTTPPLPLRESWSWLRSLVRAMGLGGGQDGMLNKNPAQKSQSARVGLSLCWHLVTRTKRRSLPTGGHSQGGRERGGNGGAGLTTTISLFTSSVALL